MKGNGKSAGDSRRVAGSRSLGVVLVLALSAGACGDAATRGVGNAAGSDGRVDGTESDARSDDSATPDATRGVDGGRDAARPTDASADGSPSRDGAPADAGPRVDAAPRDDAAPRLDAGGPTDAARPADAAAMTDAGGPADAAPMLDAAAASDAAPRLDAAGPPDAAPMLDAAGPPDAAPMLDAAAPPDAAPMLDAAAPPDAAPMLDAGPRACAADEDCAADEVCHPRDGCVARCRPGECGDGFCGPHGWCEEGGCPDGEGDACADVEAPTVEIALERPETGVGDPVGVRVVAADDRGVVEIGLTADGREVPLDDDGIGVYTPDAPGRVRLVARAADAAGNVGTAEATLEVRPAPPRAIVVARPARIPADDGHRTPVTLDASGSTGGALIFRWSFPPDARLVEGTADDPVVRVTFAGAAPGAWALSVRNDAGADEARGTIPLDLPPRARIAGPARAAPGEEAVFDGEGSDDPEGGALAWRWDLVGRPPGSDAWLDADGGRAALVPDLGGRYRVRLVVDDGVQESAPAEATLTVTTPDLDPPVIAAEALPPDPAVGEEVALRVAAEDPSGVALLRVEVDAMELDVVDGVARFTPEEPGRYAVVVTAIDRAGNRGGRRLAVHAHAGEDDGPPVAEITGPADGALVEGLFDVTGTADDGDLVWYALEVAPRGGDVWTRLWEGDAPVVDGLLGRLDPSALAGGFYDLRLAVEDAWGHRAEDRTVIEVPPRRSWGNLRLEFPDARVPLVGVPIRILRVYDSGRLAPGDFGVGWQMRVTIDADLDFSHPPGHGWRFQGDCLFSGQYVPTRPHLVTVRLGHEAYRFAFEPQFTDCFRGPPSARARFVPLPGTDARLVPAGSTSIFFFENRFRWWDNLEDYAPAEYVLHTPDGYAYRLRRDGGVAGVRDPGGIELQVTPDAIRHPSGITVDLHRDDLGRVTAITLPDGAERTYTYDGNGDLRASTDFEGRTTFYEYDLDHHLVRVVDPRGLPPGTIEYDETGRVVAVVDGQGRRVAVDHDPIGREDVVTDAEGNVSIYQYDERGNVTRIVDALGGETRFTYDDAGRLLTTVDPLGHVTRNEYDADGNQVAWIDANGERWSFEYDADGNRTGVTDPEGRTRRWTYDAAGRVTSHTDAAGGRTTLEYDDRGQLDRWTDPVGAVSTVERDDAGRLTRYVDPEGVETAIEADARGRPRLDRHRLRTHAGERMVEWRYGYDGNGALTRLVGPDGAETRIEHDALGQVVGATGPLGQTWTVERDALGRVIEHRAAGRGALRLTHDAKGRPVTIEFPDGARERREYDALGRLVRIVQPDGSVVEQVWDAASRLIERRDAGGNVTRYVRDPAGRVTAVEHPDGGVTRLERDRAGRLVGMVDPLGGEWRFEYDGEGRPTATTTPTGAVTRRIHDAAGRVVGVTTPTGGEWRYEWSPTGALARVIDPAGNAWTYGHDAHGVGDRAEDPLGRVTTFVHDPQGRLLARTWPDGSTERRTWDAAGRLASHTGPDGAETTYTWSAAGRPLSRTFADGTRHTFEYDAAGRLVAFADGDRRWTMTDDPLGRLAVWRRPDGLATRYAHYRGGPVLAVETDAGATRLRYDGRGGLAEIHDPWSGVTRITRDAAGRATRVDLPDGAAFEVTPDPLGRPVALALRPGEDRPPAFAATYVRDEADRIIRVEEDGRTVDYAYDALDRLVEERITYPDGAEEVLRYGYDAVGNVIRLEDAGGARALRYDERDRLLEDGVATYEWSVNGTLTRRDDGGRAETFTYDALGRLVRVERPGAVPEVIEYAYDPDGLLVERRADGEVTRFVWDHASGDGLPLLLELRDGENRLLRRYVHAGGRVVARYDADGAVATYATDHLGTVRAVVTAEGVRRQVFDAYGRPRDGTHVEDLGFIGAWTDPATGFVYLRSRWYAPSIARFIQPDADDGDPHDPRSLNRYAYAFGDPVHRFDPAGTFPAVQHALLNSATLQVIRSMAHMASMTLLVKGNLLTPILIGVLNYDGALDHWDNETGTIWPFLGASLGVETGRNVTLALSYGRQVVRFHAGAMGVYSYWGVGATLGTSPGTPGRVKTSLKLPKSLNPSGRLWDAPLPPDYAGWMASIKVSGSMLLNEVTRGEAAALGPIAKVNWTAGVTVFRSIRCTYRTNYTDPNDKCGTGGKPRYAHGISQGYKGLGFGSGTGDALSSSLSLNVSLTWYRLLHEMSAPPQDPDFPWTPWYDTFAQ